MPDSKDFLFLKKIVDQEAYKCIRCGECRTVCPVFRESPQERYTARGKIAMAKALLTGELDFTGSVREAMDNCLVCTGCADLCASGVRADKVVLAVRRVYAEKKGVPLVKKAILKTLGQNNAVLKTQASIGSLVQPLMFKQVPETSGLHRRFPFPLVDQYQYVPKIARTPFRENYHPKPIENPKAKVMFFTGCMTNYAMTDIAEDLVYVLNTLGVEVVTPLEQGCCGMPMMINGDSASVERQARRNINAFCSSNLPIITACASCGHMLKEGYLEYFGKDHELYQNLEAIANRTMDMSQYLVNVLGQDALKLCLKTIQAQRVTYHDPCHLRKAQKVVEEPRKLLQMATDDGLVEMQKPASCCGFGGTYTVSHMERSKKILEHKIDDVDQTEAEILASACPGCILQLRDGIRRSGRSKIPVKHVITILAEAMGKPWEATGKGNEKIGS